MFNNAGVSASTFTWESTLADWEWTLGVNVWSAIRGIHTFVPLMLEQRTGHCTCIWADQLVAYLRTR